MKSSIAIMALALAVLPPALLPAAAYAASGISTEEEHVLRGFFDRQSSVITADKLAEQKGSPAVQAYAQSELAMYQQLGTQMQALYTQFKLATQPNPNGVYRPLTEGQSRGVDVLPPGASYSKVMIFNQISGKAMPAMPAMARRTPQTCKSPTVPGCGPKIAPGIDLATLSGTQFDQAYLLLTVYGHDAMLRHAVDELNFDQGNPDMLAFAKAAIKLIDTQSASADALYRGTPIRRPRQAQGSPSGSPPAKAS